MQSSPGNIKLRFFFCMTEVLTTESSLRKPIYSCFCHVCFNIHLSLIKFFKFSFSILIYLSGGKIVFALYCGCLVISSFGFVIIK